jgi:hypothetical protein
MSKASDEEFMFLLAATRCGTGVASQMTGLLPENLLVCTRCDSSVLQSSSNTRFRLPKAPTARPTVQSGLRNDFPILNLS